MQEVTLARCIKIFVTRADSSVWRRQQMLLRAPQQVHAKGQGSIVAAGIRQQQVQRMPWLLVASLLKRSLFLHSHMEMVACTTSADVVGPCLPQLHWSARGKPWRCPPIAFRLSPQHPHPSPPAHHGHSCFLQDANPVRRSSTQKCAKCALLSRICCEGSGFLFSWRPPWHRGALPIMQLCNYQHQATLSAGEGHADHFLKIQYEESAYWIAPLRLRAPKVRLVNTTCDTVKNIHPAMPLRSQVEALMSKI